MDKIKLATVGCGGMGTRHLHGLRELDSSGLSNIELVAACDYNGDNAELFADTAEKLFGKRPKVYTDLSDMLSKDKPDAIDLTTDPAAHHTLACIAMENKVHVMVEKPMGLTVKACLKMIESAKKNNVKLAVAENYRRDPVNRLIKALIDQGFIGKLYLMLHHSVGSGNRIVITPWRHMKDRSGITLDVGVHYTDIIQYYMGEVEEVYGYATIFEKIRYKPERQFQTYEFFKKQFDEIPDTIQPTAEDTSVAMMKLKNGAFVDWTLCAAGHGTGHFKRAVYGSKGSIDSAGERNGRPARLRLDDWDKELVGAEILQVLPDFELDQITSTLFSSKCVQYEMLFNAADTKLIAVEYFDFAKAILEDRQPEVDGILGMKAVATIYAILESATIGAPVKMEDIESGKICEYQREIDQKIGLSDEAMRRKKEKL